MDYFKQESTRLHFRKLTENDIPTWIEFFENNDSLGYLGIDLSNPKETLAKNWILKQLDRYSNQGFGHLAVEIKATNEFIGMGGILPRELHGRKEYEIAYSLLPKFWKQGFGTEIAQTMRDFGFQHIETDRFISIIDKENLASIHVAKKNGMQILFETEFLGMSVYVFGINNH